MSLQSFRFHSLATLAKFLKFLPQVFCAFLKIITTFHNAKGRNLLISVIGWSWDLVKEEGVGKNDASKTIPRVWEDSGTTTELGNQEQSMFEKNST